MSTVEVIEHYRALWQAAANDKQAAQLLLSAVVAQSPGKKIRIQRKLLDSVEGKLVVDAEHKTFIELRVEGTEDE